MFKQFVALIRGRSHDAAETFVDRNALAILRQQIRDCAGAIAAARRAAAMAIAQNEQEVSRHNRLAARIDDLEQRTVIALEKGEHQLARDAAETIALLETERSVSAEAQKSFTAEIDRLKTIIKTSEARLRELQRGQQIATVADKALRLREVGAGSTLSTLKDAEETLSRLRARQKQIDVAATVMDEMEQTGDPAAITEKLAAAGCGAPLVTSADAVLKRLAERAGRPAPSPAQT